MPQSESRDSLPPVPDPLPHRVVDNHCHLDMGPPATAALDLASVRR